MMKFHKSYSNIYEFIDNTIYINYYYIILLGTCVFLSGIISLYEIALKIKPIVLKIINIKKTTESVKKN